MLQTFHLPFVPLLSGYSHILLLELFMHLIDGSKCWFIFRFDKLLKWFYWWKYAALIRKILSIIMFSFFNLLNINVHFIFCMICFAFTCLCISGFICLVCFCIIIVMSCFCAALVEKCFSRSLTAFRVKYKFIIVWLEEAARSDYLNSPESNRTAVKCFITIYYHLVLHCHNSSVCFLIVYLSFVLVFFFCIINKCI